MYRPAAGLRAARRLPPAGIVYLPGLSADAFQHLNVRRFREQYVRVAKQVLQIGHLRVLIEILFAAPVFVEGEDCPVVQ
jgi:hypothetical protein